MSLQNVSSALKAQYLTIDATIKTVYENSPTYTPQNGVNYQSVHFKPSINTAPYINETNYEARGIFQITLFYAAGNGTNPAMNRANEYLQAFGVNSKFEYGGTKVSVVGAPDLVIIGNDGDRFIVAISIEWRAVI